MIEHAKKRWEEIQQVGEAAGRDGEGKASSGGSGDSGNDVDGSSSFGGSVLRFMVADATALELSHFDAVFGLSRLEGTAKSLVKTQCSTA